MNAKFTKQILTVLPCSWLVQSTAQANFYGPAVEPNRRSPSPGVKSSADTEYTW